VSKTPEGVVKDVVKTFLKERRVASLSRPIADAVGYYHMYVPSGYGDPQLDFTGCYKGRYFAVETKARGNTPSAMQNLIMKAHQNALGFSIWGDDAEDICRRLGEFFDYVDTQC
jgi:hypothetical protein